MILDIYKDSLEYAAKEWKTLIKLGLMTLFSFLLIPIFLIIGYNYRVVNQAVHGVINGKDPLPDYKDLVNMFVDGLKVFIIQLIYFIVPVIIFLLFIICAGNVNGTLSIALTIIGCLITLIATVLVCLASQMGICHMAKHEGALGKAFALSELKEVIDEIGWFECILTYVGLIIITVVIAFVVSAIIGIIFTMFGVTSAFLGANAGGIFILGALINSAVTMFIVGPYLSIFNARSIRLLYATQM